MAAIALVALSETAVAKGHKAKAPVGAAYTETNDPAGNSLIVYDRYANGSLKKKQTISTAGKGSTQDVGCGSGCPILDSQGAVVVSNNGAIVAAVNAGSNTVSTFYRGSNGKVKLADTKDTGGQLPNSVAIHGDVLYVLNADSQNIAGFNVSRAGKLTAIPGSLQPMAHQVPAGVPTPRGLDISSSGKVVAVTGIATQDIETFVLDSSGAAGPATSYPSADPFPFGIAFGPGDRLVIANIKDPVNPVIGSVSSYSVADTGAVTAIKTESSHGGLPCWVVITKNGKFTYVVNTGAGEAATVAGYGLSTAGQLTFLGLSDWPGNEFARTDEDLSRDDKYLYVLSPSVGMPGKSSRIDVYKRHGDGSLTLTGHTSGDIGPGASGLAAR